MLTSQQQQKGLSLIEMMISIVVGLIVVAGVTSVYISTIASSTDTLKQSKLNQEMAALVNVMSSDLRRAGIWGNMTADIDNFNNPQGNPFSQANGTALDIFSGSTKVLPKNMATNPATYGGGDCILYSYDTDQDGVVDNSDVLGFRRIVSDGVGVVQMRTASATATARNSCTNTDNTWTNATDSGTVNITELNFTLAKSACINVNEPDGLDSVNDAGTNIDNPEEMDCYVTTAVSGNVTTETRQVDITLTAQLAKDSSVKNRMTQAIRVRNDLVIKQP